MNCEDGKTAYNANPVISIFVDFFLDGAQTNQLHSQTLALLASEAVDVHTSETYRFDREVQEKVPPEAMSYGERYANVRRNPAPEIFTDGVGDRKGI